MTEEDIIKKGREVVTIEGKAVLNLINTIDTNFYKTIELMFHCKGRVVLTGMGKSGLIARKIVATLNSTGTPAIYMHPTDALHGDLGMVRSEDIVIMLSKSGNTEEILTLIPMFKRLNVPLVGMIGDKESKMAKECDILLYIEITEEACPFDLVPTASTTTMLVLGDALAVALIERRGFTEQDFAMLHPGGSLGKRLSLKVSEIMQKDEAIPVVKETTSLKDTIFEITSKRLGVTAVVNASGKLAGIITDGDLRRLLEKDVSIKDLTAGEVMSKNPKKIPPTVLASYALQLMENHKITSLMVVDEGSKPVGIVHLHDLVDLGLKIR